MSRIRGRDTTPELLLRQALWRQGMRYRTSTRVLGILPDILFLRAKLVVFVDGCFWHGCPEHYVRPRSSSHRFWATKLAANTERDGRQTRTLEKDGWHVLRIWEHEIKCNLTAVVQSIAKSLSDGNPVHEEHWAVVAVEPVTESTVELYTLHELRSGREKCVSHNRKSRSARTDDGGDGAP